MRECVRVRLRVRVRILVAWLFVGRLVACFRDMMVSDGVFDWGIFGVDRKQNRIVIRCTSHGAPC